MISLTGFKKGPNAETVTIHVAPELIVAVIPLEDDPTGCAVVMNVQTPNGPLFYAVQESADWVVNARMAVLP